MSFHILSNYYYRYTINDIKIILKIRLDNEFNGINPIERNVFSLDSIRKSGNQWFKILKEERKKNWNHPNRTLLIPHLTPDTQDERWVGIVVRFKNKTASIIEYYASQTETMPMPERLVETLCNFYGHKANFVNKGDAIKQTDLFSCGPCTIENLINAAPNIHTIPRTTDDIRKLHKEQMRKFIEGINNKGKNFYFAMKRADAIKMFEEGISYNPDNALLHYNKNIAKEESRTLSGSDKDTETYFVVSTIFHAPINSFNGDSSEADEVDDDHKNLFESHEIYGENENKSNDNISFPYYATKPRKIQTYESNGDPLEKFKGIIDGDLPGVDPNTSTKSRLQAKFMKKLNDKGFEEGDKGKLSDIRVSIALNRMKSVSTRKNKSLTLEVKSKIKTDIEFEKFGFFWLCEWCKYETEETVGFDEVRKFYKQLKKHNKKVAKKFIQLQEGKFENHRNNIPYQFVREYAKEHEFTKNLVVRLREKSKSKNRKANIYLSLIDNDVQDFNGVFSAYLRIVNGALDVPTVMTTGYEYPLDQEYGRVFEFIGQEDRMIRVKTTFSLPLGTYFPEPNLCILIPKDKKTIPESFIDKNRGNKLESAILLGDMQKKRPTARSIFSEDNPLITNIPKRVKGEKNFTAGLVLLGKPSANDILRMHEVSQTNFDNWKWRNNLFVNRSILLGTEQTEINRNYNACLEIISELEEKEYDESSVEYEEKLYQIIKSKEICRHIGESIEKRRECNKSIQDLALKYNISEIEWTLHVHENVLLVLPEKSVLESIRKTPHTDLIIWINDWTKMVRSNQYQKKHFLEVRRSIEA